jgi:hypothetical protein
MATPITKLVLVRGYTEAYHQMTETERTAFWDKIEAGNERVGSKVISPLFNSRWSNDSYHGFLLMEYPDMDAVIAESASARAADHFRYVVAETLLGIPFAEGEEV